MTATKNIEATGMDYYSKPLTVIASAADIDEIVSDNLLCDIVKGERHE